MNKKGFTLVELLAVVVLMLAITVMAISGINAAIERNKEKQDEAKKKVIVRYAQLYYDENKVSLKNSNCISIQELLSNGVITDEEARDSSGNYFSGVVVHNQGYSFRYANGCNGD